MRIARQHLDTMIAHAVASLPNEACGLLAGTGDTVTAVHCLENAHHSPVSYELTAQGYLLLVELADSDNLMAAFHSHTHGEAYPSPTDRRQAFWPIRYVLISLHDRQHPEVRVFRIVKHDPSSESELGEVIEEELET
jgi:proteasome lid subunit RPN8/RPN11